ncbi:MAG: right-handed parallel beta-helix repeat-containing protein [Candidatus Micrarchaeia archaeon]
MPASKTKQKKQKTVLEREIELAEMERWAMDGVVGIALAIALAFLLFEQVPQVTAPQATPAPSFEPTPFLETRNQAIASPTPSPLLQPSPKIFAGTPLSTCTQISRGGTPSLPAKYYLASNISFSAAGGKTECIAVDADYVELDCGKHALVGDGRGAGIYLRQGSHAVVKNCVATNFVAGLQVESNDNIVVDSEFNYNTEGVWVFGLRNSFGNVRASHNKDAGLYLDSGTTLNNFSNCVFNANNQGLFNNAGSIQVNSFKGTSFCGNAHDLVCNLGNTMDLGGNACGDKDSCSIACGECREG